MNKKNYQQAVRYAMKIQDQYHSKDLVHDAYIRWFNKTGQNLFDQPEGRILRVVKYTWKSQYSSQGFMYDGVIYPKTYKRLDDPEEPFSLSSDNTPEQVFLSKEVFNQVYAGLSEFDSQTFTNMIEGYLIKEMQEIQNTHNVAMTASVKRIKNRINQVISAR